MLVTNNTSLQIVDTAGIRRRGKITKGIEKFSSMRSINNILSSQICILLLDSTEIATNQDMHIADYILSSSRGMIIAINKWDLATEIGITKDEIRSAIRRQKSNKSTGPDDIPAELWKLILAAPAVLGFFSSFH